MLKFFILLFPIFLFSQKLDLFLNLQDENLYIDSYFIDLKPCTNCKFLIEDSKNYLIFEGVLDKQGEYNFKTNLKDLKVIVDDNLGHKVLKEVKSYDSLNATLNLKAKNENIKLNILEEENTLLRDKIIDLERKLKYFENFKVIFIALLAVLIFSLIGGIIVIILMYLSIKKLRTKNK